MESSWSSCLNLHAAFLRSIEQKQSSWDDWAKIKSWHERHLDYLKISGAEKGSWNEKSADEKIPKKTESTVHGVPIDFIKQSKICIKFQHDVCDQESGHQTSHGVALQHACALCLHKNKGVADHPAKSCPIKQNKKVFPQGGARGGSPP